MKFRISQWLDTSDDNAEEYPTLYGVQGHSGIKGDKWKHCHCDGEPLIFKTAKEAEAKIAELKD